MLCDKLAPMQKLVCKIWTVLNVLLVIKNSDSNTEFEDLSVTDSTTSKFEKMEKIVKTLAEDQNSVVNDHAPSSKTNNNIR